MATPVSHCPFCGGMPIASKYAIETLSRMFRIGCDNKECHVQPVCFGSSLDDAIGKWNDRTPEPWLPIETAPRDGTKILIRVEGGIFGMDVIAVRWLDGWRNEWRSLFIPDMYGKITGWQPLPPSKEGT